MNTRKGEIQWWAVVLLILLAVMCGLLFGCTGAEQFGGGFATGVYATLDAANSELDEVNALLDDVAAGKTALEAVKTEMASEISETIAKGKATEEKAKGVLDGVEWWQLLAMALAGGSATNIYKNRTKPE